MEKIIIIKPEEINQIYVSIDNQKIPLIGILKDLARIQEQTLYKYYIEDYKPLSNISKETQLSKSTLVSLFSRYPCLFLKVKKGVVTEYKINPIVKYVLEGEHEGD